MKFNPGLCPMAQKTRLNMRDGERFLEEIFVVGYLLHRSTPRSSHSPCVWRLSLSASTALARSMGPQPLPISPQMVAPMNSGSYLHGSIRRAPGHCFCINSLYMISVVVGGRRFPCAFRTGVAVDSPSTVLTSSSDLPCRTIAFIFSHLS
jgi:hypothetical protein